MTTSVRIDDDLHTWILDHRSSKLGSASAVIRMLKESYEKTENKGDDLK